MHFPKKGKATAVLSLFTLLTGAILVIGSIINLPSLQVITPPHNSINVIIALCFFMPGIFLLTSSLKIKKHIATAFVALSILLLLIEASFLLECIKFSGFKLDQTFSGATPLLLVWLIIVTLLFLWTMAGHLRLFEINPAEMTEPGIREERRELSGARPAREFTLSENSGGDDNIFRSLIEQDADALYVADLEGNITDVNASMSVITGYSKEELLHLNILDIIDPEQLKAAGGKLTIQDLQQLTSRERRIIRKNGVRLDVEINARMITDDKILIIASDITRRKQLENELFEAEIKFNALAEKTVMGIYIVQQEKFIYVNQRFAEVFGYTPQELMNLPESYVDVIINDECRPIVRENLRARYSGELEYVNYEVAGKRKDGTTNHVEFSGSRAVIGGAPTVIGTMIDITSRWNTEAVLRRAEASLNTIMDNTETAYAMFDKDLLLTAFNKLATDFSMREYHRSPVLGDQLRDYFPEERLSFFLQLAEEVMKGNDQRYEIDYPQPDGSVFWFYVRLFPISSSNNDIFGMTLALSDITERKTAEARLHAAYEKIQTHIANIKHMAWKQSHFMRSPLANLKGLIALLKDDYSDDKILRYIYAELERLDKIIIEMADDASSHE